ncbi:MAG: gamma-glutamyl-gamma-aminobutyrate hydrolase family protein, partial [Gemmatimonadales bacterium]
MTHPRIAVTGNYSITGSQSRAGVNAGYVLSLTRTGAIPVIIPPVAEEQTVAALEGMDGLLLPGGRDVDPAFYNEKADRQTDTPDRERDLFEMSMFREAQARGVPVLAICRGFQLVNVALGGTLWQDLPTGRPEGIPHRPGDREARVHDIVLHPGSRLCGLLGATTLRSNSSHHQGIRTLGSGLVA